MGVCYEILGKRNNMLHHSNTIFSESYHNRQMDSYQCLYFFYAWLLDLWHDITPTLLLAHSRVFICFVNLLEYNNDDSCDPQNLLNGLRTSEVLQQSEYKQKDINSPLSTTFFLFSIGGNVCIGIFSTFINSFRYYLHNINCNGSNRSAFHLFTLPNYGLRQAIEKVYFDSRCDNPRCTKINLDTQNECPIRTWSSCKWKSWKSDIITLKRKLRTETDEKKLEFGERKGLWRDCSVIHERPPWLYLFWRLWRSFHS